MNRAKTMLPSSSTWALAAMAVGAALLGGEAAVGFAMVAVLGFGMLHGISDLALVPASRRMSFLIAYLVVVACVLGAWLAWPEAALIVFLVASGAHFACDDVPSSRPAERTCHGVMMVAAPALLHPEDLRTIFAALRIPSGEAQALIALLVTAAIMAIALLPLAVMERRRDHIGGTATIALALAALLLLPPLIGFGFAFLAVHAGPELRERIAVTGSDGLIGYIRNHASVAVGAAGVLVVTGWLLADRIAIPFALLFAGVGALAAPHMLVTPLWRRRSGGMTPALAGAVTGFPGG